MREVKSPVPDSVSAKCWSSDWHAAAATDARAFHGNVHGANAGQPEEIFPLSDPNDYTYAGRETDDHRCGNIFDDAAAG